MSNPETLELPCKLKLTFDPARSQNYMHLTFSDVGFTVMNEETKIGEVVGCLGGAMEFRIGELTYTLDTKALWQTVREALPQTMALVTEEDHDPYDDPNYAQAMIERLSRGSKL